MHQLGYRNRMCYLRRHEKIKLFSFDGRGEGSDKSPERGRPEYSENRQRTGVTLHDDI